MFELNKFQRSLAGARGSVTAPCSSSRRNKFAIESGRIFSMRSTVVAPRLPVAPARLVTGDDLIALGHAPGPDFGRLLDERPGNWKDE